MDLQIFDYEERPVRTSVDDKNEMLFVAKDVCEALGLTNVSQAVSRLDDDEKGIYKIDTLGGQQELLCVTEQGVYELIFSSNKDSARQFKKWIKREVLPSIRKTGSYTAPTKKEQMSLIKIRKETQAAIELAEMFGVTGNQAKLSGMMTMKKYHGIDVMAIAEVTHLKSESQEKILTPTEIGKQLGLSSRKVNLRLQELGLQKKTRRIMECNRRG